MRHVSLVLLLLLALLMGPALNGDDKTEPKTKGTLYPNWKKLGLTDDQTQKIYKIRATYETQIQDLQKQIRDLRKKERAEAEAVLTPAQKERLKEIALGEEKPKDKAPPKDK